jgi:hypothetical protein
MKIFTLKLNHMLKKSIICATMLGIVFFALASSGGGKKKSSTSSLGVIPISANGTFTLKSKPSYSGSHILSSTNSKNTTVYRSVITYQKGNTTYLIPSKYRMSNGNNAKVCFKSPTLSFRSNLNIVDLKIRLCR